MACTPSALLFVSETSARAVAQAAHLLRIERLTRAKSPHTPLVNKNLTDMRPERCAARHISDVQLMELGILRRFRSTRIGREPGADTFEEALSRKRCGSSAFGSASGPCNGPARAFQVSDFRSANASLR